MLAKFLLVPSHIAPLRKWLINDVEERDTKNREI
jgi:hypothetical protein